MNRIIHVGLIALASFVYFFLCYAALNALPKNRVVEMAFTVINMGIVWWLFPPVRIRGDAKGEALKTSLESTLLVGFSAVVIVNGFWGPYYQSRFFVGAGMLLLYAGVFLAFARTFDPSYLYREGGFMNRNSDASVWISIVTFAYILAAIFVAFSGMVT
ncbi:hypothetical protein [Parahaliea aestuarii]|uniref:Uncharacterized protein n=1 Tax=Parahaliea aestuarii TaxID=1852021 RepID=A0A5C8ZMX8_9GAMM|nr:hypothetical protein [Parahaliea aestuarii]TXS88917.1 hypothetical protein FVW59_19400 [Parahaliea aestuarii]